MANTPSWLAELSPKPPHRYDSGSASSVRVLVVEDYEPFRLFVCSTLEKRPELKVVCEVADGPEAVQRAKELQPDLIVLDIGLPGLNGIEVALRIRRLSPQCKILFLTLEASVDVVQEALRLGALGYVMKAHAEGELLAAVDAVCQGRKFVSSALIDRNRQLQEGLAGQG